MYNEYFGFKEAPFSIAPDPRYLYMSDQHREAFAHLLYGIRSEGGFVLFTGEVGTGKTTVCRCLLEQLPEDCDVAFIFNPRLTVEELLSTICDELRISYPPNTTSNKTFVDLINRYLLEAHARGRKTVLIIDEAQNLSVDVLEQMRLLTNLETNQRKLLQIILLGQPELQTLLSRPELRQMVQRIVARCHLNSLTKAEVVAYVQHRLAVAGCQRPLFPPATLKRLYRLSGGVPRLINVLCDRALLGAYAQGKERVDTAMLVRAAREVFGETRRVGRHPLRLAKNVLLGLVLVGAGAVLASAYYNPGLILRFSKVLEKPSGHQAVKRPKHSKPILAKVDKSTPPQQDTVSAPTKKTTAPTQKAVAAAQKSAAPIQKPAAQAQKSASHSQETATQAQRVVAAAQKTTTLAQKAVAAAQKPAAPMQKPAAQAQKNASHPQKTATQVQRVAASAPQPVAPKAKPAPLSKLQWPTDQPLANSEALAYRALFKLWGGSYQQPQLAGKACQQAASQGLGCLSGRGNWTELQRINRPALLKLLDDKGRIFYATLAALQGATATLDIGATTQRVAVSDLTEHWGGDYTVLWRMPPDYHWPLQVGSQGPMVVWFRIRLAKVQGRTKAPSDPATFDAALAAEVEQFQAARGLKNDGIVGPQTLIRLNTAIDTQGPRLTHKKKDD